MNKIKIYIVISIVLIAVVAIGTGVYLNTKNKFKNNIVANNNTAPAQNVEMANGTSTTTNTIKTGESFKEKDIMGWWTPSLDGDEEMAFSVDKNGVHQYSSYLHQRPSLLGRWSLNNNQLTVTYDVPGMKSEVFTVVERTDKNMKLRDVEGTETVFAFKRDF